jgi:hypothetical protein
MTLFAVAYIVFGLITLFFLAGLDNGRPLSLIPEIENFKRRPGVSFLFCFLKLFIYPLSLLVYMVIWILFLLFKIPQKASALAASTRKKDSKQTNINYLPFYDKLFFKLHGRYYEETSDFMRFFGVFEKQDFIAFPIIYNTDSASEILLQSEFRFHLESNRVAFFIFDTPEKLDVTFSSELPPFFLISDANFSYKPKDIEISYTTLAQLLGIPIDGINKLVLVDKRNLKKLLVYPIERITNFSISELIESDLAESVQLENSVVQYVSEYLSLKWEYIERPDNGDLKECGMLIRQELYKRCKEEAPELINFFKLVENRTRKSKYQAQFSAGIQRTCADMGGQAYERDDDSDSKNMLQEPVWEYNVSKPPPSQSPTPIRGPLRSKAQLATEDSIQSLPVQFSPRDNFCSTQIVDEVLTEILTNENFDFESRMFLKSANMVYSMLYDSLEVLDYSSVVIGYTKFFEKELNLSIVQFLRSELGIEMPLYFNEYFESSDEFVIRLGNDFVVNFNLMDWKTKKYLSPGLGNALNCIKTKIDTPSKHSQMFSVLYYEGKKLSGIRNRAAHSELISKDEVIATRQIIANFYVNQVFIDMLRLKAALRGDKN